MSKYKSGAVRRLTDKGLISPPKFVAGSTQYETLMGSIAYGVSNDSSDCDVYGFCMPPKDVAFPHLAGYIPDFSTQIPKFHQWQQHHIKEPDHRKEWDITIYSIIKYFKLCMGCNPNMIDSLFTAPNMILSSTKIANMVRDERKMFLSKKAWHSFKGYAYSQMHKMQIKTPKDDGSTRYAMVVKHGYDVKFGYHVVRLLNEVEEILIHQDMDLMRNREQLKSIRRGEWKMQEIVDYFVRKEKDLESLYINSKLRSTPDERFLTQLLVDCMEEYYGDISKAVVKTSNEADVLKQVKKLVEGY